MSTQHAAPPAPPPFDFATAPLPEAQRRLADLAALYERARVAVGQRVDAAARGRTLHCWCHLNRKLKDAAGQLVVPASVAKQCRSEIPDGRWVSRDDGAVGPDGKLYSAVVCSNLCFKVYQDWAVRRRAEARGVTDMPRVAIPGVGEEPRR